MGEKFRFIPNPKEEKTFEYVSYDQIIDFSPKSNIGALLNFYYIDRGEGYFRCEGESLLIKKGDLIIQNPEYHVSISDKNNTLLEYYGIGMLDRRAILNSNEKVRVINVSNNEIIGVLIKRIFALMTDPDDANTNLPDNYFSVLLEEMKKVSNFDIEKNTFKTQSELVYRAKEYIDYNFLNKITIDDLANNLLCSPSLLLHEFKKWTGKTIIEYVLEKKLEIAIHTIKATKRTFFDISEDVGFSSPQFFYKYFKQKTGLTPKQYRNKYGYL